MLWHMNFDTNSHLKFKTYSLENNSKHIVKNRMFNYYPQNYTWKRFYNQDIHFIITIYKCLT